MRTREIPREEWAEFLESFNRRHPGWLMSVEGPERFGTADLSFHSLTADLTRRAEPTLFLSTGATPEEFDVQEIPAASRLLLRETDGGIEEGLEIESAAGSKTLFRFRSAVPSETAEGVLVG